MPLRRPSNCYRWFQCKQTILSCSFSPAIGLCRGPEQSFNVLQGPKSIESNTRNYVPWWNAISIRRRQCWCRRSQETKACVPIKVSWTFVVYSVLIVAEFHILFNFSSFQQNFFATVDWQMAVNSYCKPTMMPNWISGWAHWRYNVKLHREAKAVHRHCLHHHSKGTNRKSVHSSR